MEIPPLEEKTIQSFRGALLSLYSCALAFFIRVVPKTRIDYAMPDQCTVSFGKCSDDEIADFIASLVFVAETKQQCSGTNPLDERSQPAATIPSAYHDTVKKWLETNLNNWGKNDRKVMSDVFHRHPKNTVDSKFNGVIRSRSFKKQLLREHKRQIFGCRDAYICIQREENRVQLDKERDYAKTQKGMALLAPLTDLKLKFKTRAIPPKDYFMKKLEYSRLTAGYKEKVRVFWDNSPRCIWISACIAGGLDA